MKQYVLAVRTIGLLLVLCGAADAQDQADPKNLAALTPETAGDDFPVQGEYVGVLDTEDGPIKFGTQIVALGDGKFHTVTYPGGLPGAGWNGEKKIEVDGETVDGVTRFQGKDGTGELKDGRMTVKDADGQQIGVLEKTVRKSPTLGQKPPKDAVVLFDGTTADHFQNGRLSEDNLLMEGVTSKQTFQDFTLHMEFLLSFMPHARGQGRSNSGVYMQGRYEVQILDSFGLEGKHNECGGIYSVKDPDVNMCLPPLSWQTYDIDFTAARYNAAGEKIADAKMTVRHNGVPVHQDVTVPKTTTAAPVKAGPEPGPIYIQNHGNPLRFRNIWVLPKK